MKKKEMWILGGIIVVVAAVLLWFQFGQAKKEPTQMVEIRYQNQVVQTFDPSVDAVYHIQGSYGGLDVEVKNGEWHVTNEECPNHICSKTGWSSLEYYLPIICLPNEVTVILANPE